MDGILRITFAATVWRIVSSFAASLGMPDAVGVESILVLLVLLLGLAAGLPMGLLGLIAAWTETRRKPWRTRV
jgi:hypothetical protein